MITMVVGINMSIQLYHNPRCTKSRLTLALLQEKGLDIEVVEYLKQPPTAKQLELILTKLNMEPMALIRHGEDAFKSKVRDKNLTRNELIEIMVANPVLIERPIVICGDAAAIGRPPERVLAILPKTE